MAPSEADSLPLPVGFSISPLRRVRKKLVAIAFAMLAGSATAATVTANYTSASVVPVVVSTGYTATGNQVKLSLGFAPSTGTNLMIVKNKGTGFIAGRFSNLAQGQRVKLSFNGIAYRFVANYFGGTGNDLVLQWAYQEAWGWGLNSYGQLGGESLSGDGSQAPFPVSQAGTLAGKTVLGVATGANHSLALCSDGTIAGWGDDTFGQLGDGTFEISANPVSVNLTGVLAGKTVVALAAGEGHSLALCSDGTVAAWGRNHGGQLGNGSTSDSNLPVAVIATGALAGKTVIAIAAGGGHSLALCSDGKVVAWGDNVSGDLGNGKTTLSKSPVAVKSTGALSGKTVVGIAAGISHSLAVCSDSVVVAWGGNSKGQLGNGTTTDSSVPVMVSASSGALKGKTAVAVGAGYQHSLAVCSDGTVAAWGWNEFGQLGNNRTEDSGLPVAVRTTGALSGKTVTKVTGGNYHSLAVCADGTAAAWGANGHGMLGNNTADPRLVPVAVSSGGDFAGRKLVSADCGEFHNMAVAAAPLSRDSTLSGLALSVGTLSHGFSPGMTHYAASVSDHSNIPFTITPVAAHPLARITINGAVVASGQASAVFPKAETLITISVTAEDGSSTDYQVDLRLSHNFVASVQNGSIAPVTADAYMAADLHLSLSVTFTPSFGESITLINNTGLNPILGEFLETPQGSKVAFDGRQYVVNYFGGDGNDLVLIPHLRSVGGWGQNSSGILGNGTPTDGKVPVAVTDTGVLYRKTILSVAAGLSHNLVLCSDGTVAAWGNNNEGQLGDGTRTGHPTPVAVDRTGVLAGKTVVAIAAGTNHSLALCSDGTVAAWGSNSLGCLGDGTGERSTLPVAVDLSAVPGKRVVGISARSNFNIARCSDGTLLAWGENTYGQLGFGYGENKMRPVGISRSGALSGKLVRSLSTGNGHALALCSDGTVVAWGWNSFGQIGDGSVSTDPSLPVAISSFGALSGKSVMAVAAGDGYSLALCSGDTLAAWGFNGNGQLGIGTTVNSNLPALVTMSGILAGKSVSSISAGIGSSLAVCSDGTVAAWGANSAYQLGDGTATNRTNPVAVSRTGFLADKKVIAVSSGAYRAFALVAVPYSSKLSALAVSAGSLSSAFSPDISEYFLSAPASISSVIVTAATVNYSARLRINGELAESGVPSAPLSVGPGQQIYVEVIAEDGTAHQYLIHGPSDFIATITSETSANRRYTRYDATGWKANLSLGYAPTVGASLKLIENTGLDFITGRFGNLAQGQPVDLSFGGRIYHFVANYYGGTGNDLVLEWANRSVASWGCSFVQSGDATVFSVKSPIPVDRGGILHGKTVVSIASSAATTVALCADGTLAEWRGLGAGIIGDAPPVQTNVPTEVSGTGALLGKQVVSVATGSATSVAVCSDGTLAAWGLNDFGQVGDGTTTYRDVPVTVISRGALVGKIVVSVAVGAVHCLALCSDGTVVSWGRNYTGQLGNGTSGVGGLVTDPPVQVLSTGVLAGKQVVAIGAGSYHSLALCSDGTLVSWGDAGNGRLGNGSSSGTYPSPVLVDASKVLAGKTVLGISVSADNSAALCSDGSVAVWGYNADGQLGTGTTATAYAPVALSRIGVLAGKTIASVAVGDGCMFATCSDGTVAAWGRNSFGQLGDGTFTGRKLPVLVDSSGELHGKKVLAVASGGSAGHSHAILAEPDEGFIAWMSGRAGVANKTLSGDSDQDGIPNLMEYVLNGDPAASSSTILPSMTADGADFVFHFTRLASSGGDTTQIFQYSADMTHWTDVEITAPADAGVGIGPVDGSGNQSVSVTVPKGANIQMFGRLKVAQP